jgi:hypothetical protein
MGDPSAGLGFGGRTVVEEMSGTARNACLNCLAPLSEEIFFSVVGCLAEGEVDAFGAGRGPIDSALITRDIDAVDGAVLGAAFLPIERVCVTELGGDDGN